MRNSHSSSKNSRAPSRNVAFRLAATNKVSGRRITVAFFEPEEDEEAKADPRPRMLESARRCWNLISGSEEARQTVRQLIDAGCDWVQLLWCVNGFCEHYELPGKIFRSAFSRTLRGLSKRISGFEQKIRRWEADIRAFNEEITDYVHVDLSSHAPDFEAYRAVLSLAQKAALPSGRKQNANEENATYLYHLLVESTARPHYKEVADLIEERLKHTAMAEVAYEGLREHSLSCPGNSEVKQKNVTIDATDLQKIVKRFRKNNPERSISLLYGVRFGLKHIPSGWRKMPALSRE
jgi:hypothetical protein